ncbi:MAG TPA: sulfurtransferase TusA family protein [Dehalococcoidia bacterium]|nr:sulfurtransferase TusA family protein [Dehalococcoidia bacterium]
MSDATQTITEVDVRGEICPFPMMKAVEAMKKAKADEIIQVLLDHAPALETIPTQAARLGWEWEVEETGSPEWRMTLRRKV